MPHDEVLAAVPVETFQPGEAVPDPMAGDFYLTHGDGRESRLIRRGQALRFRGDDRTYTYYNHAGLFIDAKGAVVEAQPNGVMLRNISHYTQKQYTVVRIGAIADERDREQMVSFARASVGERFGWVTMASTALHLVTGGRLAISLSGTTICSGLVARCLERSSLVNLGDPAQMMPADLAKLFDVKAPG
jgi:hypothetical protein